MGSSFFEFNIATTGVFTAKTALEVTSHNVANSATKGYSRQVPNQKASTPLASLAGVGMVGTGSETYGISQIRDFYLDKKYWAQNQYLGEYSTKKDQLDLVEASFNALGDSNLTEVYNKFFNDLSSLSFDAGEDTYRSSVITYASSLADNMNYLANHLVEQQRDINDDVYAVVQKINDLGSQIIALNKQIYSYEIVGNKANDLRDQRALLVDELSQYANINVKEVQGVTDNENDLQYKIFINGQEFVNHFDLTSLECVKREDDVPMNPNDAIGLYDVVWSSGLKIDYNYLSGELKGLLDVRDGNVGMTNADYDNFKNVNYKGIPYYINKLNNLVRTLAKAFNEGKNTDGSEIKGMQGHLKGYDSNGDLGGYFFTYRDDVGASVEYDGTAVPGDYYDNINAFNFCVSGKLANNPSLLAASDTNPKSASGNEDISNNKIILGFVSLKDNQGIFKEGSINSYIIALNSSLGVDTKQSKNFNEFYKDVVSSVDNQRLQVSGVSINEEIVNIVRYQQLYKASCQLINAINEIYDMTINRMGV